MATQINFRADPETKAALDELTADGTAVSEVIRKAIQDARRAARRAKAVAEMEAIMADPEQRRLAAEVYREMSNLSRGDVHQVRFAGTGHGQQGQRYAVVVQAPGFDLSTTLVCPTSTSARPAILHPTVVWDAEGTETQLAIKP